MASYEETLQSQMNKFRELKEEEKAQLDSLKNLSISGSTLDNVRAEIKATFERRRKELREDRKFKAALAMKNLQKLFNSEEIIEEQPKPSQFQEEPKPVNQTDEDKEKKIGLVCPNCGCDDHEPGAKFCHVCATNLKTGKALEQQEQEEKEEADKKSKKQKKKTNKKKGIKNKSK